MRRGAEFPHAVGADAWAVACQLIGARWELHREPAAFPDCDREALTCSGGGGDLTWERESVAVWMPDEGRADLHEQDPAQSPVCGAGMSGTSRDGARRQHRRHDYPCCLPHTF